MIKIHISNSNKNIFYELQQAGFNIVRCGNCNAIRLHKIPMDELDCEACGFVGDISDFPDLIML